MFSESVLVICVPECVYLWVTYSCKEVSKTAKVILFVYMVNLYTYSKSFSRSTELEFTFLSKKMTYVPGVYEMVLASICEHASSAFVFASMGSEKICLSRSEHFSEKIRHGKYQALLRNFFPSHLSFTKRKRCFAPSNLADNSRTEIDNMVQPITSVYSQL